MTFESNQEKKAQAPPDRAGKRGLDVGGSQRMFKISVSSIYTGV